MKFKITPELTREYLLRYLAEEDIFEYYLNIKVVYGKKVLNTYRKESEPSVSFKRYTNLVMTDWSGWFKGDCIKLVQFLFRLTYREALRKIYEDMIVNSTNRKIISDYKKDTIKEIKTKDTSIRVKIKDRFVERDFQYWDDYHIQSRTLAKYRVYAPEIIWLNDEIIWTSKSEELCFGYYLGQYNDREIWKIYYPERDKNRFLSNCVNDYHVQGWGQLSNLYKGVQDTIIITKSLKDTMVLSELGVDSVSVNSESEQISISRYKELEFNYKDIYLLFDNDKAGIEGSKKFINKFPTTKLLTMPEGSKDISDYIKENGKEKTQELIQWFLSTKTEELQS